MGVTGIKSYIVLPWVVDQDNIKILETGFCDHNNLSCVYDLFLFIELWGSSGATMSQMLRFLEEWVYICLLHNFDGLETLLEWVMTISQRCFFYTDKTLPQEGINCHLI